MSVNRKVTGDQDFICGPAAAREIAEDLPGARLVVLPDAGHFAYIEQAERFARAVRDFVTGSPT